MKKTITTTTFEHAKVGDKVFSWRYGWGTITRINKGYAYAICVKFDCSKVKHYTFKGFYMTDEINPELFHEEVVIKPPTRTYDLTPPAPTYRPLKLDELHYGAWFKFKQEDNRKDYFRLEHVRRVDTITEVKLGGCYYTTDKLLELWLYSYDPAGGDWLPCGVEVKK